MNDAAFDDAMVETAQGIAISEDDADEKIMKLKRAVRYFKYFGAESYRRAAQERRAAQGWAPAEIARAAAEKERAAAATKFADTVRALMF